MCQRRLRLTTPAWFNRRLDAVFRMDFSTKVRKFFNGAAIVSGWEHLLRRTHPVDGQAMIRQLDPAEVARIQRTYPIPPGQPKHHVAKYSNIEYWIPINVERAQDIWLDRQPPSRVLDLGCGPGYFPYVCRCLGHECIGLDVEDNEPVYLEVSALLKTQRVISRIEPLTPLPELGGKFDLVTAHRICFHRIGYIPGKGWDGGAEWGRPEWEFFLRDIRARVLKPGGRLLLDFNPKDDGTWYSDAVRAFFLQEGGKILRSKVLLPQSTSQPARFKPKDAA